MTTLAAAVQLTCTSDRARNDAAVDTLVRRAARYGATLVCTPENTNFLGPHEEKVRTAEPLGGPTVTRYRDLARELGITLLIGSVNEAAPTPGKCFNTSVLIGPDGKIITFYRKIHLFDVDVSDDVRFMESDTVERGHELVVAATPHGMIGMSVCYDLRFPELYRGLVDRGARILTIPSAFTLTTGKDHWEPLVRARAIECQAWVIAPGQVGHHDDRGLRHSWGHSMIVDPWGHVVGMAGDGEGLALAEIDLERVERTRRGMPLAQHRRL
ncbi:MAG: carbon-nitrogen hydrolase family protein [Myxococcales bacterium]|nr:carbon-nitrogen hydrolase family protein [Myxococcales bacterium]MCB9671155.1 carbon-nitrogen hydrolase family protein [Alphaproteobacteria bacterium]MCB9691667.1 carbon-nitrogen hydrolase family protein [Alphaproteobacteria bacterium]